MRFVCGSVAVRVCGRGDVGCVGVGVFLWGVGVWVCGCGSGRGRTRVCVCVWVSVCLFINFLKKCVYL